VVDDDDDDVLKQAERLIGKGNIVPVLNQFNTTPGTYMT
jgi:hypothetical protein